MAQKDNKLTKLVKVRSFEDIFAKTGTGEEFSNDKRAVPENNYETGTDKNGNKIAYLSIETLVPFAGHPFRLYSGKKLPMELCGQFIDNNEVFQIKLKNPLPTRGIGLIEMKSVVHSNAVEKFKAIILANK